MLFKKTCFLASLVLASAIVLGTIDVVDADNKLLRPQQSTRGGGGAGSGTTTSNRERRTTLPEAKTKSSRRRTSSDNGKSSRRRLQTSSCPADETRLGYGKGHGPGGFDCTVTPEPRCASCREYNPGKGGCNCPTLGSAAVGIPQGQEFVSKGSKGGKGYYGAKGGKGDGKGYGSAQVGIGKGGKGNFQAFQEDKGTEFRFFNWRPTGGNRRELQGADDAACAAYLAGDTQSAFVTAPQQAIGVVDTYAGKGKGGSKYGYSTNAEMVSTVHGTTTTGTGFVGFASKGSKGYGGYGSAAVGSAQVINAAAIAATLDTGSHLSGGNCYCEGISSVVAKCGDTFMGNVTLGSSLFCDGTTFSAIKLSGADAKLDCKGNYIVGSDGDVGIELENGATAVNCKINGFGIGVTMTEGDNAILDSEIVADEVGVKTSGAGCMTVGGVQTTSSRGPRGTDGLLVQHSGTVNILHSEFVGHDDYGVQLDNAQLCAYLDNVVVKANGLAGIYINAVSSVDIRNSRAIGNDGDGISSNQESVDAWLIDTEMWGNEGNGFQELKHKMDDIKLYGSVVSVGNGEAGLAVQPSGEVASVEVWCEYFGFGNGLDGMLIQDTRFTVAESGHVEACANQLPNGHDLDITNGIRTVLGNLTCDRTSVESFQCPESCPTAVGEARICVE